MRAKSHRNPAETLRARQSQPEPGEAKAPEASQQHTLHALDLGRRGVDLMVTAVDTGQLEERALAVAYGNLSTMYAEQGDDERSRNYAEMASRAEASSDVIR